MSQNHFGTLCSWGMFIVWKFLSRDAQPSGNHTDEVKIEHCANYSDGAAIGR